MAPLAAGPRVAFLFPGQGAPVRTDAGAVGERLPAAQTPFVEARLTTSGAGVPDHQVQLAVIASSLAALRALRALGVEADVALGHSLGELAALHWAGAFDAAALLRIARARGAAMTTHASAAGAMATVRADAETVDGLASAADVTVACANAPRQHVVSGHVAAVAALVAQAREDGIRAVRLNVVGAFHSPLMRPAIPAFEEALADERFEPLRRPVISSVTGGELDPQVDLKRLLARQIADPVRFAEAAARLAAKVDLMIEVGPGRGLAGLVAEISDTPVVSIRIGEATAAGLDAVAAAVGVSTEPMSLHQAIGR